MQTFLGEAIKLKEIIIKDRRQIHRNPEISTDLPQTTAYVMKRLCEMGYEPEQICKSGVIAYVGKNGYKTFLLRAEMDALPMQEESGLDFQSCNQYAHTCGHDNHVAMLLGAAQILKDHEHELEGCVKLMFQPDEEGLTGAATMIKSGVLKGVDVAMAIHSRPASHPTGTIHCAEGPILASIDVFTITINGQGGHGAMPHLAVDPIQVLVHIYLSLQGLVCNEVDASRPLIVKVGMFQAGSSENIIPQSATLKGTIRTFDQEVRNYTKRRMIEICNLTAQQFKAKAEIHFSNGAPPTVNDPELSMELIGYLKQTGLNIGKFEQAMGSDDFSNISMLIPTAYFSLAMGGDDQKYKNASLHNPKVIFNEDALPYGVAAMVGCAVGWLKNN